MSFLLILTLLAGVTVFPVMVGARVVGAGNRGLWSALFSVLILAALSAVVPRYFPNHAAAFAISTAASGVFLAGILDTTFLRALAVSVIIVAVQFAVILVFAGAILSSTT
ncbi:MAG: hypothetical protein P4L92_02335 [Rudaea sp.]|nr:hypothetical protein [Rudaea sp.]